jgi:hypothetical protein
MAGTPQPQPQQQPPAKPRMLCPIMSYATQQVPCVEHHCAVWMTRDQRCGLIAHNDRLDDNFERLLKVINEIKSKI